MRDNASFYSLMFVVIAVALFIATAMERLMFALSGENLTERLRSSVFKAYLRQEIAFFDDPKNSTGALTTRLATEVSAVQGVNQMIQACSLSHEATNYHGVTYNCRPLGLSWG